MNELQIFSSPEFGQVRTMEIDGKVYAAGTDIARSLGYANPQKAIRDHCKGVTKRSGVSQTTNQYGTTTEQTVEMNFIPEGDIYRLIVNSKLPSAEKFEAWVFNEVLPSIRKHGAYLTPAKIEEVLLNPDTIIRLATDLKAEREKNLALTAKNDDLEVKLNESEKFWTIMKLNQHFNLRWNMETCQRNGKAASAYSRQHGYEVRKCRTNDERFKETNSYAYEVLERLFLPAM